MGMKKLDDTSETIRLQMVTTAAWVAFVDEWRRRQPDLPNRSDAIRRMVNGFLEKDTGRCGNGRK